MIDNVDTFIKNRLELIQFNHATAVGTDDDDEPIYYGPIKVYSYLPEREKGETEYPCFAFLRAHVDIRENHMRPGQELFIPVTDGEDAQVTVDVPRLMGGGTLTGYKMYTRKPYPTPVDLYYEIDTLTTDYEEHNWLTEMIYQLFPPGFQSNIPGINSAYYASFVIQKVLGADELEKPVFRSKYVLGVLDLWLDRVEHYPAPAIQTIDFVTTA